MKIAASAAREQAADLGVSLACPWCRKPVETDEAKENEHMHWVCRMEFRLDKLDRALEAQGIVIDRMKRQLEGAWREVA